MDKRKYSNAWKTRVRIEICTWTEFCTHYRNDLNYSTLAKTKQNLELLGLRELRLHHIFWSSHMWRYQDIVFTFKLGNLGWLTCKGNHWPLTSRASVTPRKTPPLGLFVTRLQHYPKQCLLGTFLPNSRIQFLSLVSDIIVFSVSVHAL
jgi:hypothetical protein